MLKRLLFIGMSIIFMLTTVIVPYSVNAATGTTYYVDAINGSDTEGDGSSANPWKTISKAASVMVAGDTCKIRSGIYRETVIPANSGTAGAYITFEAEEGADVTISGADLITSEWESVSENVYRTSANLVMGNWKNQVFVDGVAMNLARYPNAGTDPLNPVFLTADSGTDSSKIKDIDLTQPDGYWDGAAVIVMDKWRWAIASTTVKSYVTGQLNLDSIATYGLGVESSYGSPYYLIGKLEALDSENEWYYDSNANKLYLGMDPTGHTVEVKARTNAFDLKGKNYIRIKGVNIFAATIDAGNSSYCEIDGINGKYLSHYELTFTTGVSGSDQNFKTSGINIGGSNNVLKNSTLAYSPGNLVSVAGEDNKIINNVLHDSTYGPFYACEAACIYNIGKRTLISHNTLYNSGRSVISGSPDNCIIQYNKAWNAMMLCDDGGFVYHATTDGRGTEYHHNIFIGAKANPPHFMSGGIYLDQGAVDFKVYNNVIADVEKFGIFFHHYNMFTFAYNNTLYDKSFFRMKDDRSSVDGYGTRVINNISTDEFKVADEFGIRVANNLTSGDPMFVNPSAGDFRLQASSPAIDAGMVIEGLTGQNPDIGAYEYGEEPWKAGHDFENPPNPTFETVTLPYENLLKNGFFERDNDIFGGWTKTYGKTAVMLRDGGDSSISRFPYTRGVRLGSGVDGIEQVVEGLEPNTEYELRGFARMGDENQKVRISVKNYGGTEKYSEISSTIWAKGKVRFTTGPNSTSATVSIYKTTTGNFAYVDDVTLVKVDPEAPEEIEPVIDEEPPLPPNTIRVNDSETGTGNYQFNFVGTWSTTTTNPVCYKRDNHWTNAVNSYYEFKFYGVKIDLYCEVAKHLGICAVSIDGGPEELVDLYSEVNESRLVYSKDGLEPGVLHTLKVRVTGEKNPSATGTYHVADRIDVQYDPSDADKLPVDDEEEPEPPVVVFSDDFESGTPGQAPEGWTINDADGESSTNIITVEIAANSSNPDNKAIRLKRAADGNGLHAETLINGDEPLSGIVTFDLRVMAPNTSGWPYALMLKDSGGKDVVTFGLLTNGKFGIIKKSSAWQELSAYSANRWYDVQIIADTDKDTFDLSIDGKLELVGEPLRNNVDNISKMLVSAYSWSNTTVYVDDIMVRTGTTWPWISDALLTYDNDDPDKTDLELDITLSGNNLIDILDESGKKLERGKDYTINGSKVAISKNYLKTLEAGDYVFTFDIDRGVDPVLIVTVSGTPTPVERVATIDPQEQTYDRNPDVNNDVIVTLDPDGLEFNGITDGSGNVLAASDYAYNAENNTVTFNRSYLNRLQEGENTFIFDFGMENNPVLTVNVVDTRPVTILFNEDFENGVHDAPVTSIDWVANISDNGYAKIIAQGDPANNVVKVDRTKADANEVHIRKKFTPVSGVITIDARIMADQTNQLIYALMVKNDGGTNGVIVGFQNNGKLSVQARNTAWKDLPISYEAGRWYDVRIIVDTGTNKYDLYVDGVQYIFGDDTRNVIGDVAEIVVSVNKSEKTGAICLDDILVRTGSVNSELASYTASFDKNPVQQADVEIEMNAKGNKLRGLKDSEGQDIGSENYSVTDNKLTISKEYLAGLENGAHTFTLDFNYGADLILTVNVEDTTPIEEPEASITPVALTYDKNPEVESDLTVTMDPDGLDFNGIIYEGEELDESGYTVTGNVVEFRREYLNTLETGTHEFIFDFGMDENPVLTITIVDTTPVEEPETPDFEISTPVVRDAAGNVITALANSLVVDVEVSAVNNSTEGKTAVLVVALYDSGNTMRNFSKAMQTVAAGDTIQLNAGFKLPDDITGYYIKVFVLDGLDTEGDINLLSDIITIQ